MKRSVWLWIAAAVVGFGVSGWAGAEDGSFEPAARAQPAASEPAEAAPLATEAGTFSVSGGVLTLDTMAFGTTGVGTTGTLPAAPGTTGGYGTTGPYGEPRSTES